jgi:hypothetical protein
MRRWPLLVLMFVLFDALWLATCVSRIPEPAATPDIPRISWVVRAGSEFGQQPIVCQSDPRMECVVPPTSDTRKSFATATVYMHPVGTASTAYRGSIEVTFFATATGVYGTPVDLNVQARQPPVATTLSGLITQMPGQYVIAVALIAYPSGEVAREIREAVPVTVK